MRLFSARPLTAGVFLSLVLLATAVHPSSAAGLSFEERVAAQRTIEEVYWRHRIWPKENPQPKPPLSAVMSDEQIRAKVEAYLRESNALARLWQRPVTGRQLQAELERMSRQTRDPETLRELYAALGGDARLIAETLGRQTLVERLIRDWYARDERFHAAIEQRGRKALAGAQSAAELPALGGDYAEATYALATPEQDSPDPDPAEQGLQLEPDEWSEWTERVAGWFGATDLATVPLGHPSALIEESDRFFAAALLSRAEGRVRIATVIWPKRSFDSWWDEQSANLDLEIQADAESVNLPSVVGNGCLDDMWTPTSLSPGKRFDHSAVWTGTEMIVWGGFGNAHLNTGLRYNPATNSWLTTSVGANVPALRKDHTAVWTGTEMIIWGGRVNVTYYNSGGRYDPTTDTWTATSVGANVPSSRYWHTAVWTGTGMVVWGGYNGSSYFDSGGRYDPGADTWIATSTGTDVPLARCLHATVWTGTEMIVWGGQSSANLEHTGGRYNPRTDTWVPTSLGANVPQNRQEHSAVWTGTEMIVWGGIGGIFLNTGGRYDPATDIWISTSTGANVPSARQQHTAVWTGSRMVVWGGSNDGAPVTLGSGGAYDPSTDTWSDVSPINAPQARTFHTAVWTGTEMIVWGGSSNGGSSNALNNGARYEPETDTWATTSSNPPSSRLGHTAVWTGTEMIVWGGAPNVLGNAPLNDGGRYNLSAASWTATSQSQNVPLPRAFHTAVWTGTEMIVWGGKIGNTAATTNTGGRYNPGTDRWAAISTGANVPVARMSHTAVWTGNEMIVFGGWNDQATSYATGARYSPATDTWVATASGNGSRANHTAVWTGNEMIVWGGFSVNGAGHVKLSTGSRYTPSTDTWSPTSSSNVPAARRYHSGVWTGSEMIVWGGETASALADNTGGRYNPVTNSWTPTSLGALPLRRAFHTGVWTGTEMIVWGGRGLSGPVSSGQNTGERYDPSTNTWTATSTSSGVPPFRTQHTTVWTGSQMIVWGGTPLTTTGGAYCASGCTESTTVYADADSDGFGTDAAMTYCTLPAGYVLNPDDCDDTNGAVHPQAVEINDALDNQCPGDMGYGSIDELSGLAAFCDAGNKDAFCWIAQPGATAYQAARASQADFTQDCAVFPGTSDLYVVDDEPVGPSEVRFYLVRALLPNSGSWGQASSGAERSVPCAP